jgi:hypothetical protein
MVINCIKFILVNDMKEQQNDDSVVNPLHNELVILLNNSFLRSRLILSRGNEEIDRLAGWACRHERASEEERQEDLKKLTESCNRCAGVEDRKIAIGTGVNRVMIILNAPQLLNVLEKKILKKESVDLLKDHSGSWPFLWRMLYYQSGKMRCQRSPYKAKPNG